MLLRFKSAIYNAISGTEVDGVSLAGEARNFSTQRPSSQTDSPVANGASTSGANRFKYGYQRPIFLQLFTEDEIQVTADHLVRPIMVPRDVSILPWYAGYAEAVNAGKSVRNEDQAVFHRGVLRTVDIDAEVDRHYEIPYVYFGTFDGHAGAGCAIAAANELHQVVHKRLTAVLTHLIPGGNITKKAILTYFTKDITTENLIVGALEAAFWEMDAMIGEDKKRYKLAGGCTAIVSLFILGKLYVANAGDSRAILCRNGVGIPMSNDFTPVSERQRLQQLGYQKPHLLGDDFTRLDFSRRPLQRDVGKQMLYRDAHMTGWTYKEITLEDLKFPMVYGEGKRSRLLATIGVTRGFGDHDLRTHSNSGPIYIKPFLSPQPEVLVLDIENEAINESDVLVMATDGLWDVVSNDRVAEIVESGIKIYEGDETKLKYRFISIAQDLVMAARGKVVERHWKRSDGSPATIDDISTFAIPIHAYKEEYLNWKETYLQAMTNPENTSSPVVSGGAETANNGISHSDDIVMEAADVGVEAVERDQGVNGQGDGEIDKEE